MIYFVWVLVVFFLAILAWMASGKRYAAVLLIVAAVPILYGLKQLKPETVACDLEKERVVLGYKLDEASKLYEKGAIYVLLDDNPPIYCHIPYTDGTAEGLQKEALGPEGQPGFPVLDGTADGDPTVSYVFPTPDLPAKE